MNISTLLNLSLSLVGLRLQRTKRLSLQNLLNSKTLKNGVDDLILRSDYDIDTVVDVGVAGGTAWLYKRFPGLNLILIDPLYVDASLEILLKGRNYEMHECALGSKSEKLSINFDKTRPSLSSFKKRTELTTRNSHFLEKREVDVKKLDEVISESTFNPRKIGLKIDTEGFELEVLKGSTETLQKCKFVICEASIEKRFQDSYSFSELILFMHKRNFKLKEILRFVGDDRGVVRMADVLFEPY